MVEEKWNVWKCTNCGYRLGVLGSQEPVWECPRCGGLRKVDPKGQGEEIVTGWGLVVESWIKWRCHECGYRWREYLDKKSSEFIGVRCPRCGLKRITGKLGNSAW